MEKQKQLSIRDIAQILGVSRETVRRDLAAAKREQAVAMEGFKQRFLNGEIVPKEEIEAVYGPISDYDAVVAQWVNWHKCAKNGVSQAISDANVPND